MRTLATLFLVFSLAPILLAQSLADSQGPPEVVIEYFGWDTLFKSSTQDEVIDAGSNTPQSARGLARPAVGNDALNKPRQMLRDRYLASLLINNSGVKGITSIEWEYWFLDQTSQKINKRFKFRSKQKISPGATVMLSEKTGFIATEFDKYDGEQKIVINRVEFRDGTFWQRH
jgi:hypothetical protein